MSSASGVTVPRALALGASVALLACPLAPASRAAVEVPAPGAQPTARASVAPREAVLLVSRVDAGYRTRWLEAGPNAAYVERAVRPEAVISTADGLIAFRQRPYVARYCEECNCKDDECPSATTEAETTTASFVDLKSGQRFEPDMALSLARGCSSQNSGVTSGTQLDSIVGSRVYLSHSESAMACGAAHPSFDERPFAFDLESRRALEEAKPSVTEAELSRIYSVLAAQYEGCVFEGRPTHYRFLAAFDRRGKARGFDAYTAASAYVCGTGPGHYSVLGEFPRAELPEQLRNVAPLPAWVLDAPELKHARPAPDGVRFLGASVVRGDAQLQRLLPVFQRRG